MYALGCTLAYIITKYHSVQKIERMIVIVALTTMQHAHWNILS